MLKAKMGKEIVLRPPNEVGELAKMAKAVAEKGVNIVAMTAWSSDGEGEVRLVTDDNLRAVDVLRAQGYEPREAQAVLIDAEHKPGILRHLGETLARERIDIKHLYATATLGQDTCLVVLNASDNERAMILLND